MVKEETTTEKRNSKQEKKTLKRSYFFAVGRRREAIARVRLYPIVGNDKFQVNGVEFKKGDIIVNQKAINDYFRFVAYKPTYNKILKDADIEDKFVFSIKVKGGGLNGQLDAILLGIARSLEKYDKEKYRPLLKAAGYLTRDPRTRERRKVGTGGKARRKKQSPKR